MNDYLSKPFRPNDLVDIIKTYHSNVGELKVTDPDLSLVTNSNIAISPEKETQDLETVADILAHEFKGNTELQKEFLRRSNDNTKQFITDFKLCIENENVKHLRNIHHNLVIIMKFFKMEVILDNISNLIDEGNDFVHNKTLIETVIKQVSILNKNFEQVLEKYR